MQKIVYQTDADGLYVGTTQADRCQIEPDNWLIPGGCVVEAPPECAAGQRAKWTGSQWLVIEGAAANDAPADEPAREPAPTDPWAALQGRARSALQASDLVAIRCYKGGIKYPASWKAYDAALREICAAESGDPSTEIPQPPAYPAGS